MRRSADFSAVVRSGARVGGRRLVVHQQVDRSDPAALVGLVVSRSVGGSVIRHRVSRRLRAQLADRLDTLPTASGTVVRALPAAQSATSAELGAELDRAFQRLASRR
jgi:ribonuclease P protein component